MKTADQIAETITEKWTRLHGEHREDVIDAIVEGIEADRAQRGVQEDPLIEPDEKFPGRPHTLDFARLSGASLGADELSEQPGTPPEQLGIDEMSLHYTVTTRVAAAIDALGPLFHVMPTDVLMGGAWVDGFAVGMLFERRGGARPEETVVTDGEGSAL